MEKLLQISKTFRSGCFEGFGPYWKIEIFDIKKEKISQSSFNFISQKIEEGYKEGEIAEDEKNFGYWKLTFQNE